MANPAGLPGPSPPTTIRAYVNHYLGEALTPADALPFATRTRPVAKGEVLTGYGQQEQHVYFLTGGLAQMCLLRDGGEKIVSFYFPGDFLGAYASLLTQAPSDVQVTALTAGAVEVIRRADLLAAYETSLLANRLGRFVTEQLYLRKLRREQDFLGRSADERYADLLAQQPHLVARLPVDRIARYLGIHPSSLSRIRHRPGPGIGSQVGRG